MFNEAGHPVAFADVRKTPDGRSRGFAVVALESADAAAAAVEALNEAELGGRRISVRRYTVDRPANNYGNE
jgi:RNA recognition motif-containing protein